jgi:uncharacterized protein YhdP
VWDIGARHWLVDKMDKGRIANIKVDVPFTAKRTLLEKPMVTTPDDPDYTWDVKTGHIKANFDYTGVTIDYRPPMLPSHNTTGTGVFEGLSLTLDFGRAKIGNLNVPKGRLFFDDLITPGTGHATLNLSIEGPIASLFEYLEREPIAYKRKVSIDGSKAEGRAQVELISHFPTTKDMKVEDVKVEANAKLQNLVLANAVKGMTLAGDAFDLNASQNHFKISGTGTLDGQPATIMWHELFSPTPQDAFASKLEADIQTNKALRERFVGTSVEARTDGIIPATISMTTKPDGHGLMSISATLDDAKIDLTNPFNFIKDKGVQASVTLNGVLKNGYIQSLDKLKIKGDKISLEDGSISFTRNSKNEPVLSSVNLKNLMMGDTNANLKADFKNEHDVTATVTGSSFDARGVLNGQGSSDEKGAYDVSIDILRLLAGPLPLTNVKAKFVGRADGTIESAVLDGAAVGAPVKLRYGADGLLWESSNAGAALAAFGVSERVRGGKLLVQGNPFDKGQTGDMKGRMLIENFSVVKAPALAKLINVLSLPGLLNILSQDIGLKFKRMESDITWLNHREGTVLQFRDGSTSGASLGLTFEGEVNMTKDTIAMQGTAVPMSEINGLLANIPMVGKILTGGNKGSGIFAATYTMKGQTADPDVTVNPLSVLTPGILRRILFEGSSPKTK